MGPRRPDQPAPRRPGAWTEGDDDLPRWVSEELARVTPTEKVAGAISALTAAARSFAEGRHDDALSAALEAKRQSPRDATIREVAGLSAYRLGRWEQALRELRTYRRLSGDTTHVPVEMDVLRALDRPEDVDEAWRMLQHFGGDEDTLNEARVVYGSFLLDREDPRRAWEVTGPSRLVADPSESETRVWYVAARAARALGDRGTARKIYEALERADEAMPGLDQLDGITSG